MENPEAGIVILGVNETGYPNSEVICEGRDLPWLLDTEEADWWGSWGITYRDVVILNRDGNEGAVFNLTEHDLGNSNEYDTLKALLLSIAGQESITTTTSTPSCLSELIYGEHSEETERLRYFRDNVLTQSPEGQEFIRLYYEWSPLIVKAMEKNDEFQTKVEEMIDGFLELIVGVETNYH